MLCQTAFGALSFSWCSAYEFGCGRAVAIGLNLTPLYCKGTTREGTRSREMRRLGWNSASPEWNLGSTREKFITKNARSRVKEFAHGSILLVRKLSPVNLDRFTFSMLWWGQKCMPRNRHIGARVPGKGDGQEGIKEEAVTGDRMKSWKARWGVS